jgi:hypothetical protein
MNGTSRAALCLLLAAALSSAACITFRGPEQIRREISGISGVEFDREMGFTVRRSGMWLVRTGMRIAGEDEASLRGVRSIQVGIYQVRDPENGLHARVPIEARSFSDWDAVVRVHEDDEDVLVMVREHEGSVRNMLVVVSDEEELVLVRMKGRLDGILEEAMAEAFDQADRPELYDRAREERGLEPVAEI